MLSIACGTSLSAMAGLSIGERDKRLLQLREWMFGSCLQNTASCPKCLTPVEWETDLKTLQLQNLTEVVSKEYNLEVDGFTLCFRLPNSNDLLKAASDHGYYTNPKKLLSECILEVQREQHNYETGDLPDAVLEALSQRMGEEDPQADIQMSVNCPACSHNWEAPFDVMSYLWIEVDNWAKHILQEVYVLARACGWSEHDILSMSAQRRQLYLEMLRS